MNKKDIIRIINEEVSNFDFLGNDEYSKEEEVRNLLGNEDFQKQFICDSLLMNNKVRVKIQDSRLWGNWEDNTDNTEMSIEYYLNVDYAYDQSKDSAKFQLYFDGERVSMNKSGEARPGRYPDIAPESDEMISEIDWHGVNVTLWTMDGDEIKFLAFEKAPPKIQVLFIRQYIESFIGSQTNLDVQTPERKDNIRNVPYC